ncbi:MAG: sigma-70 family RNA polymerase sigma factor [Bryobacterales bacterium]|nr:sigma-70 family RNA polymerase sigma factor [Bryobacterales bacterium]
MPDDRALAAAMLARDRKAAAEFVQRFSGPLVAYVRSRLQPRWEDVDDIVQDSFLTALRSIANYRGDSPLRAWLLGIARHKVEDHYRARLRLVELPEEGELAGDPGLDSLIDRANAGARASAILCSLPEHYRLVLLWRYWDQRSASEMAALTGKTVKSMERLLARARAEFRTQWLEKDKEVAA